MIDTVLIKYHIDGIKPLPKLIITDNQVGKVAFTGWKVEENAKEVIISFKKKTHDQN